MDSSVRLLPLAKETIKFLLSFVVSQAANTASLPFQAAKVVFAVDGKDRGRPAMKDVRPGCVIP